MKALFLVLVLFPLASWGWSGHFLVTDWALKRPEYETYLRQPVEVEPIETFLKKERAGLAKLFDGYYDWLKAKGSKRFKKQTFDTANPTLAAFWKSARLNPATHLRNLRRLFPGEKAAKTINLSEVSPWEWFGKGFITDFVANPPSRVTVRDVLTTYADEPDWEIDHALWSHPDYGYGKKPYGKVNDDKSGAAFHMQFVQENWLVKKLSPGINEGMVEDRLELFLRLSRLAFKTGHAYWGNRFAAWAFHYIQDESQPYHAKAVPSETLGFYIKFIFTKDKGKKINDTTQLVANRHMLYEDFIRGITERAYQNPSADAAALTGALANGPDVFSEIPLSGPVHPLFEKVATTAVKESYDLDESIQSAYGERATQDPTYDPEKDPAYDNQAIYQKDSKLVASLVEQGKKNLTNTGIATRTILKMCLDGQLPR